MPIAPDHEQSRVDFWEIVAAVGPIPLLQPRRQAVRQAETVRYGGRPNLPPGGRISETAVSETGIRGTSDSPPPNGQHPTRAIVAATIATARRLPEKETLIADELPTQQGLTRPAPATRTAAPV